MKDQIDRIITNFQEQQQAYIRMADMAQAQLTCLHKEQPPVDTNELTAQLQARQDLLQEIDALNSHNKSLQKQITEQLGLPEFVLSCLESKLEAEQYESLSDVITGLGDILAKINAIDEQNHILIKKQAGTSQVKPQSNRRQAQNAYQQAVQQGKKS